MTYATREAWLMALVAKLLPVYRAAGAPTVPKVRVSIGRTSHRQAVGECWHAEASADRTREIFIRPDQHDPAEVAATLAHELVHACLPREAKHGHPFRVLGLAVGLEGKPTQMEPGPALALVLKGWTAQLGPFPHAKLTMVSPTKKQTTRLLKVQCLETGYVVRVTRQWLVLFGPPLCGCCETPMALPEELP